MSSKNKLVKNTFIYAIGDIFPRLLSFLTFPILTLYLTPEDYGIVNYVNTINTFLLVFGFLGVNTYFLVFYHKTENNLEQKRLLGNLFSFVIILNLIFSGFLFLLGPIFLNTLGSEIKFYPYMFLGICIHFFSLFSVLPSALYRILEKPLLLTLINVSRGLLTILLTVIFVVYFRFQALGVLYSTLLVSLLYSIVYLYTCKRYIVWNLNIVQLKNVLKFSLPLVPGSLAYFLTNISDRVLIEKFLGLNDLGIFSTASSLALILNIFSYGAYKAIEPYIFKHFGNPDFNNEFEKIRDIFVYVLLIGTFGLGIFSKEFFILFSNESFHLAYKYVPLILIGVYFSGLNMLYSTIITAKSRTKINMIINLFGAFISITFNFIFLERFGLVAAALVSSFSIMFMFVLAKFNAKTHITNSRPFVGAFLVAILVYLLVFKFSPISIMFSLSIKVSALIFLIFILSFILSVNPFKLIEEFKKK